MSRIRVVVVSDDVPLVNSIRRVIASELSIHLVGEQVRAPFEEPVRKLRPDVVLLDSQMPAAFHSGQRLSTAGIRIILLAAADDDEWVAAALTAGVRGVLLQHTLPPHLLKAIRVVHAGQLWARRRVLEARISPAAPREVGRGYEVVREHGLSERENAVLVQAAKGMTNKQISESLAIGTATVKAHLSSIYQKLALHRRSQLAAAYHGLLAPSSESPPRPGRA